MGLILYLILAVAPWALFGLSLIMARWRMDRLRRRGAHPMPPDPPRVTVLIPAKDEGEPVRACLDSVLALDYPNFRVIAIDDRSTDSTGAIFDEYAARFPDRITAMHVPTDGLPPGWLGKCNALQRASRDAEGEWLLFVDSDVKVQPSALSLLLARAVSRQYDAVSIMTRLECHGFWETLVLPLAAASVGAITLMSMTNEDKRRSVAFANGQFFLVRRSCYDAVGGHGAVKDHITEDVALMRILKGAGYRTRLYFGQHLASTRMHTSLRQMFHGWARIYSGVCDRNPARIILAMLFLLAGLTSYVTLAASLVVFASSPSRSNPAFPWIIISTVHVVLVASIAATLYRMSRNPMRYALAFPIAGAVLLAIHGYAVRACRTGRIAWRGTTYTGGSSVQPAPPAPASNSASGVPRSPGEPPHPKPITRP